jgi:hypothetical protein
MGAAVVMLQQSLKPGKNDKTIQFASVRKFQSAFSNAYQASVEGQQAMVMAKDTCKMTLTKCPTYGEFFERFMRGMHKRMGEISRPDRALPLDVLLEMCKVLEREWEEKDMQIRGPWLWRHCSISLPFAVHYEEKRCK